MATGTILVGTSGFSYPDWVGPVYESGTPRSRMLEAYCRLFPVAEINSTYYAIPAPRTMASLVRRTPPGYPFTVKLPRELTHQRENVEDAARRFLDGLAPLREAERLAALVAQFPWSFKNRPENREYLHLVADLLAGVAPLVVEFRHAAWLDEQVFALLRERGLAFCAVDEPQLPGLLPPRMEVTANPAYVRFHSRDADKWWSSGGKQRYNYLYSQEELLPWVPKIREAAEQVQQVFVFFNNCHMGHAARNARMMMELLGLDLPFQPTLF